MDQRRKSFKTVYSGSDENRVQIPEMHGHGNFLAGQRTTDNGQTFFSTDNGHRTPDRNFFRRTTDTDNGQAKIDGQRTTDSGQRTKFLQINEFFRYKMTKNAI
ncbi:hypothetical protein B9Z55_028216 [Caenorhabditis nigoni]|uniref:Uncharacterized protein n=1 Tax=Caenorhabditis nigoni TaxID=1611254 RepID=A0A2G5SCR8_9PELO|nr:hypothetical protein B9Z55_028216 [Caenorhabditis nigoni]